MIVDAHITLKNVEITKTRVEIRSQKYKYGRFLFALPGAYKDKTIKLFTDKNDINPIEPFTINGIAATREYFDKLTMCYGMWFELNGVVYVYVSTSLI